MSTTVAIITNRTVTGPVTSPVWTAPEGITSIQTTITIVCPTDTTRAMQLDLERSVDSGATWSPIISSFAIGGVQPKGPGIGQPLQSTSSVDVINPAAGDQFRAYVVSCNGSFVISASVVTTP